MKAAALLIAGLLSAAPAAAAARAPGGCELQFPSILQAECGQYSVSLRPDKNVNGHPVTLDLVVGKRHEPTARNLVELRGHWHGLQPFSFAAPDFQQGADRSTYGNVRVLPIGGTTDVVRVRFKEALLGAGGTWQGGRLRLRLSIGRRR